MAVMSPRQGCKARARYSGDSADRVIIVIVAILFDNLPARKANKPMSMFIAD